MYLLASSANVSSQWLVLVLYGITGALFAYCVSLIMTSPLAAFAAVAGYQIVMFIVNQISLQFLCYVTDVSNSYTLLAISLR
jgi:hypothetical protein